MNKNDKIVDREIFFEEKIERRLIKFNTTWGLFSPKRMDVGSKLLLKRVKVNKTDKVLDLGCGYGALGVTLAGLVSEGSVLMVDKDFVAVEYANKNVELNGLKNAEAKLSNMLESIDEDKKFDLIVSNLPAKVSKEMYWIMFEDIEKHLELNGRVYLVIIKGLKKFIKRTLKEKFGNCKRVAYNNNYILYMAEKIEIVEGIEGDSY